MGITKTSTLRRIEKMMDFSYWLNKLSSLWWAFAIVVIGFGLTGYLWAKNTPVKYKSSVTFALDDGNKASSGLINLASELGMNFGSGSSVFSGDNIYAIVKSRNIIENVLLTPADFSTGKNTFIEQYLQLTKRNNKPVDSLHFSVGLSRDKLSYAQDSVLKAVYQDFSTNHIMIDRPDKRLTIYELSVQSPSEEFTKMFTDEIMAQSNKLYTDILTRKSKETLETLEKQAAEMKRNLNTSISEKAAVQDANLNPAFSKAQIPVTQQQANIQTYGAAYSEIFKNLEMARFQYLSARPIIQIIDDAHYPMEKVKKSKLITSLIFAAIGGTLLFLILWFRRVIVIMKTESDSL